VIGRYLIVPDESSVEMSASSSLHPIRSRTNGLEGWLDFGAETTGHLELAVDRLRSGNPLEDREMRRRVDARRFPTITGDLTGLAPAGDDGHFTVRGDVTFRGVTRTYEGEMTITAVDDDTIRLEGSHTFDVRDFGMEPPRILLLRVHPDVAVTVEIVARAMMPR